MKTYVLTISKAFPATHLRKGEPTDFWPRINSGDKKHTIRNNFPLWKKRIDEVNEGKAIISLRQWMGKPYNSPQLELHQFTKGKIGIQELFPDSFLGWFIDGVDSDVKGVDLAQNDGLSWEDFKEWFKSSKVNQEMAIIHFTDFRY